MNTVQERVKSNTLMNLLCTEGLIVNKTMLMHRRVNQNKVNKTMLMHRRVNQNILK